ncbi:hypothetical protein IWW55_000304 [Coemansia sp. RSA 2706]|nr:hypothetical protein IWW55_000304 [Coemansia sp. RSA 2706]KAJ2322010.1 hypothetical protein IWW52_000368 [Coemansia sp. RSA 2704]KAJ2328424.1 hypothetical protein IWW51_001210 [Coemansia sp. RSA 2702]
MSSEIAQVEGCEFTTDELQLFHRYYKYDWQSAGLAAAPVSQRIQHFVAAVDPAADSQRLRDWLRTMGIVDESEKTAQAKLYDRFERYDFAAASGFNQKLADVYDTEDVTRYGIGERMERAKAQYYNDHVEPLDYDEYKAYMVVNAPKPVCPYQDMWDLKGVDKESADTDKFANVKTIDIAQLLDAGSTDVLTLSAINRFLDAAKSAYDDRYFAVAVVNSRCSGPEPMFLPALDSPDDCSEILKAAMRLRIELRNLNRAKPVVFFANGVVDASTLGILLSTPDIITSEMFCVSVSPTNKSAQAFPLTALYDWAHLASGQSKVAEGTAEYILCHPELVLRSAEWMALELGTGFVSHRKFASGMEQVLLAASCPPPHTRDALRKACAIESVYAGPSKISVWEQEVHRYFAPLAGGEKSLAELVSELQQLDTPWTGKYLAFVNAPRANAVAEARVAGMRVVRGLEYSQALALELLASIAWSKGTREPSKLFGNDKAPKLADILMETTGSVDANSGALQSEVPGECPFAKMYRKNPDRFKHVDLKSISDHRSLNLK